MDPGYWKERCTEAEAALAKARSGIVLTELRKKAIAVLGDLHQDEWMDTPRFGEAMQVEASQAIPLLVAMEKLGLVERLPGRRGVRGTPARWRLGYLVQVEASE